VIGTVQLEHQAPADHVAKYSVWLPPVPCLAQEQGQRATAGARVLGDQGADEANVFAADLSTSKLQYRAHRRRTIQSQFLERKTLSENFFCKRR
jgi:hypothetical protein